MALNLRSGDARRFARLSHRDKVAWGYTAAAVLVARLGLKAFSLPKLASTFGLSVCRDATTPGFSARPEVVAVAAQVRGVLARWPSESPCLVGSLAAGLRLRALRPKLFIGVRRRGASIVAHAWLDVDGARVPITLPDDALDFVTLRRTQAV
jgi:hypothetical protein